MLSLAISSLGKQGRERGGKSFELMIRDRLAHAPGSPLGQHDSSGQYQGAKRWLPQGFVHSPNSGWRGLRVVDKTLAVFFYRRSCTVKRIITERRCCCCMLTAATCGPRSNTFTCDCRKRDKMLRYGAAQRPVKFSRIHVPCCQSNPIERPKGHGTLVADAWSIELLIYSIKSFIDPSTDITRRYMHTEEQRDGKKVAPCNCRIKTKEMELYVEVIKISQFDTSNPDKGFTGRQKSNDFLRVPPQPARRL